MKAKDMYAAFGVFYLCLASYVIGMLVASSDMSEQDRGLSIFGLGLMFIMAFTLFGMERNPRWPLRAKLEE